jgi:hypothetical protein
MVPSERTVECVMKIRQMMKDLSKELKRDVKMLADPQARAIFEVAAQSLEASIKAILDFEEKKLSTARRKEQ